MPYTDRVSGSTPASAIVHRPWAAGTRSAAGRVSANAPGHTTTPVAAHALHAVMGIVDDVFLLLLIVFLIPVTILLIGTPIALLVRLAVEVGRRLL